MKIAVISTDNNDDYLFYLPVVAEGWFKLGYDVHVMHPIGVTSNPKYKIISDFISHLKSEHNRLFIIKEYGFTNTDPITTVQSSRLFAAYYYDSETLITSDADMLVKKDIFTSDGISVYGHDITNYEQIPMCYVSMNAYMWRAVIGIDRRYSIESNMERIITSEPLYHEENKWCTDQEILTKSILKHKSHNSIKRGIEPGSFLPLGRLDRYGWKHPAGDVIDVHLPKTPELNYNKIAPLCGEWIYDYFNKYYKK